MKNYIFNKSFVNQSFILFVCLAYFWGIVSFQHYLPSGLGFYLNIICTCIVIIGLMIFFLFQKVTQISLTSFLWLAFFILLLAQPVLSNIVYSDSLVISSFAFLLALFISVAINNFNEHDKIKSVYLFACFILGSGIFTVFTQLAQVLHIDFLFGKLVFYPNERPIGNIGQVNQAAFVHTLAISTIVYLVYEHAQIKKKHWILAGLTVFWLSMGLGFSASRAGLLFAVVAMLSGAIFYQASLKERLFKGFVFFPFFIGGYIFGTELMVHYMNTDLTAVSRIVNENSVHLRVALLEEAWLAFSKYPITGIGWGELINFGLQHANEIKWFTVAHHSHNIFAQIAAELGLLGLMILFSFVYVLLKNLRFDLPNHKAFAYSVLSLVGLYSLSEFPLWYIRFLILTVFFIAILDSKNYKLNIHVQPLLFMSGLCFCLNIYYIHMYKKYAHVAYLTRKPVTDSDKMTAYQNLPNVFGYSKYKELILFLLTPISEEHLEEHITLGNRVLSVYLTDFMLIKQANLLAVAGKQKEADKMFQAACLFEYGSYCQKVVENLEIIAKENPDLYSGYLDRFKIWHEKNISK